MNEKLDLVIKLIEEHKDSTEKRLDSIDINLAEHMKQTMLVREQNAAIVQQNKELVKQTSLLADLHGDNQHRIARLEEPRKALKLLKDVALWISAISGAVLIIIKLSGNI